MNQTRSGYLYGFLAYLSWGFFPLYWPLLAPAPSDEVLAHRFVWSLIVCIALVTIARLWKKVASILRSPRQFAFMTGATFVIAINWGFFIWGVTNGYVIEASLGYFINPLITVAFGVIFLGERLRPLQWTALAIAALAVVVLTVNLGRLPWLALTLAFSFGTYGLIKKKANLGAIESLSVETLIAFPFALSYLIWLSFQGNLVFGTAGSLNTILLIGTGIATAFPLLMFGAAAIRIPLTSIGLLQYMTPSIQFIIGLVVFREPMEPSRWFGFIMVWLALCFFTYDAVRHHRRLLARTADASAM